MRLPGSVLPAFQRAPWPSPSDHSRSTASASSSEPRACAALSSARSACAFAAFSPSLAWVSGAGSKYASAFSAVPEGRLYPKLRHFLQPSTSSRAAGEAARSSPRTVISPVTRDGSAGLCSVRSTNQRDFEISSEFASSALSVNSAKAVSTPFAFNRAMRPFCSVTIRRASSIWRAIVLRRSSCVIISVSPTRLAPLRPGRGLLQMVSVRALRKQDRRNRLDVINARAVSRRAIALGSVVRRCQLRLQCRL